MESSQMTTTLVAIRESIGFSTWILDFSNMLVPNLSGDR